MISSAGRICFLHLQAVAELAEEVWDLYGHDLGTNYAPGLTKALGHVNLNVREAAAEGLADAMDEYPNTVQVGRTDLEDPP